MGPAPPLPWPATVAAPPSSMPMMLSIMALCIIWVMRTRCPPAIWPVSCAITPMSWFGVTARVMVPVFKKR